MLHCAPRHAVPLSQSGQRDRLAACPDALFVYGTLQFPEVLDALLGRIPASRRAAATGWRAAALEGRVYPGLVPAESTASGLLLIDLPPAEWRILDDFEDDRYDLRRIALSNGEHGWAYVWPFGEVLAEDWDPKEFTTRHLDAYSARCSALGVHRDLNGPGSVGGLSEG